jgi:hypothetical protein
MVCVLGAMPTCLSPAWRVRVDQIHPAHIEYSPFILQLILATLQSIGTICSALCTLFHITPELSARLERLFHSRNALICVGICQFWLRTRVEHRMWRHVAFLGNAGRSARNAVVLPIDFHRRTISTAAFLSLCSHLLQPIPYNAQTVEDNIMHVLVGSASTIPNNCTTSSTSSAPALPEQNGAVDDSDHHTPLEAQATTTPVFAGRVITHIRESIVRSLLMVVHTNARCFDVFLAQVCHLFQTPRVKSNSKWLRKACLVLELLATPSVEYLNASALLLQLCIALKSYSLFISASQLVSKALVALQPSGSADAAQQVLELPPHAVALLSHCVTAMDKHLRLHTSSYKDFRSLLLHHIQQQQQRQPQQCTTNNDAESSSSTLHLHAITPDALRTLVISRFGVHQNAASATNAVLPSGNSHIDQTVSGDVAMPSTSTTEPLFRSLHLIIQLDASVFLELLHSHQLDLSRLSMCIANTASYGVKSEILAHLLERLGETLARAGICKASLSSAQDNGGSIASVAAARLPMSAIDDADQLGVCMLTFCTHHHNLVLRQPDSLKQLIVFSMLGLESNFSWQQSTTRPQALCTYLELASLVAIHALHYEFAAEHRQPVQELLALLETSTYRLYQSAVLPPISEQQSDATEAPQATPGESCVGVVETGRLATLKRIVRSIAINEGSIEQHRLVARFGARCYRSLMRLVLVFAHSCSNDLIVPSIEIDDGELFIENGLASASDREASILRATIRMLPLIGFLDCQQFSTLWQSFTSLAEEKSCPELLRCLAIDALTAQVVTIHRLTNTPAVSTVTASLGFSRKSTILAAGAGTTLDGESSKTSETIFLESPHGRKLQLLLQAIEGAVTSTQRQALEASPEVYVDWSSQSGFRFHDIEGKILNFSAFEVSAEIQAVLSMIQGIKELCEQQPLLSPLSPQSATANGDAQRSGGSDGQRATVAAAQSTTTTTTTPGGEEACETSSIDVEFYQLHAMAILEHLIKISKGSWMLRQTLLKALLALSDTFTLPQLWLQMVRNCMDVLQASDTDDFLANQYAIAGVAKALSALYLMRVYRPSSSQAPAAFAPGVAVATISEPTPATVCAILVTALDSSRATLCLAAFKAWVQFATCALHDIAVPLLPNILAAISKMAQKNKLDSLASSTATTASSSSSTRDRPNSPRTAASLPSSASAAAVAAPLSIASPLSKSPGSSVLTSSSITVGTSPPTSSASNSGTPNQTAGRESKALSPKVVTMRLHEHMLASMFLALQQYPRHTEVQAFVKTGLEYALRLGANATTPPRIMRSIFRGFTRILTSFSLSHTHRDYISSFALSKLSTEHFLFAMGLMITSMYTGDSTTGDQFPLNHDGTLIHMDNMERIKTMIEKIQEGYAFEGEVTRLLWSVLAARWGN